MSEKILSDEEVKTLFDEVIKHPLFVLELTEYEKSKLLEIAFSEKDRILKNALLYLSNPSDVSILLDNEEIRLGLNPSETLKKIPKELRLRFFLTEVSETALRLKVLFSNLGYDLSFDFLKLRPIQEPQPVKQANLKPEIELNDKWKDFVIEGGKLSQPEIALLCWYEDMPIPKPASKMPTEIANNLALFHGHTSGHALYNVYDEIADRTKRLTNRRPKTMLKYLENISPLISSNNLESIEKDIKELSKKSN